MRHYICRYSTLPHTAVVALNTSLFYRDRDYRPAIDRLAIALRDGDGSACKQPPQPLIFLPKPGSPGSFIPSSSAGSIASQRKAVFVRRSGM